MYSPTTTTATGQTLPTANTDGPAVQQYNPTVVPVVTPTPTPKDNTPLIMGLGAAAGLAASMLSGKGLGGGGTANRGSATTAPSSASTTTANQAAPVSVSAPSTSSMQAQPASSTIQSNSGRSTASDGMTGLLPTSSGNMSQDLMTRLAASAAAGVGRSNEGPVCYRSVKKIIAHALGKDLQCVRGIVHGVSAYMASTVLIQAGFYNDQSKCTTPGAIRVYRGNPMARGGRLPTAGDTHGHIEVVGTDRQYHHFTSSALPIDHQYMMGARRILTGCFVPDENKIKNGKLGRCPAARGAASSSGRTTPSTRGQHR